MLNKLSAFLGLIIFTLAIGSRAQEPTLDPLVLSQKMAIASQYQNFHGTFAYFHEGQIETLSIHHKYENGKRCERLVALNGPYRELIKRGEELFGYFDPNDSNAAQMGLANPIPVITEEMATLIPKNYLLSVEGLSRVAGENAIILVITPKKGDRYGHRFWVHEKTGLLLRHDVMTPDLTNVQSVIFTQVALADELPETLFNPRSTQHLYTDSLKENTNSSWSKRFHLKGLPEGFVNTEKRMRFSLVNKNAFEHWVFTDGIAKISIFFEAHPEVQQGASGTTSVMRKGATLAYGKMAAGHLITLVGEVPEEMAKMVLESIEYKQD